MVTKTAADENNFLNTVVKVIKTKKLHLSLGQTLSDVCPCPWGHQATI